MKTIIIFFLLTVVTGTVFSQGEMKLTSPAFAEKGFIPAQYTCQGPDVSPALLIEGLPAGTKSLTLIVDDPDAPGGMWVHWVVFNIPPTKNIPQGAVPGTEGNNDFRKTSYGGPCPPQGVHRYFFKLYALNTLLPLPAGARKKEVEAAMRGHIIGQTTLIGLYEKK
jgi:Raf kinase inhibitor-like YbhB/YbcL family protein